MAYPLVQFLPDLWSFRQPEVSLPTQHIAAQPFHHLFKAAAARAPGQLTDPVLERDHRLGSDAALDLATHRYPEAEPQELAQEHTNHNTQNNKHQKTQTTKKKQQQNQNPKTHTMTTNK